MGESGGLIGSLGLMSGMRCLVLVLACCDGSGECPIRGIRCCGSGIGGLRGCQGCDTRRAVRGVRSVDGLLRSRNRSPYGGCGPLGLHRRFRSVRLCGPGLLCGLLGCLLGQVCGGIRLLRRLGRRLGDLLGLLAGSFDCSVSWAIVACSWSRLHTTNWPTSMNTTILP